MSCALLVATGCYTQHSVSDLTDRPDGPISIATSDRLVYDLDAWQTLENGDIQGKGVCKAYVNGSDVPIVTPFEGTLRSKDIRAITRDELNLPMTALGVVGTGAAAYSLVYLVKAIQAVGEGLPIPSPTDVFILVAPW